MLPDLSMIPLTEPVFVDCTFVTGFSVEVQDHIATLVGWIQHLSVPTTTTLAERRIVMRCAMPLDAAQGLIADLQAGLTLVLPRKQ